MLILPSYRAKKLLDFEDEMSFDERALGNKSTGDKSFIRLFKLLVVMTSGLP